MLRSPSILILLLALVSAVKPQELNIEDIVKGTMQVIKIYRQQMAKSYVLIVLRRRMFVIILYTTRPPKFPWVLLHLSAKAEGAC